MSLNLNYITAPSLQEYFVDKDTGFPLAGGKVFFYSDVNRTQPKDVFELTGSPPNYSYSPLPNPVILSSVGTMMDNNGNDILPYYYPLDADGEQELYYIVVQSSTGVPQFTREAWPNPQTGETPVSQNGLVNYIPNGQFLLHTDLPSALNTLSAGTNVIAQGGWTFELPDPVNSINTLTYVPINFTENPSQSPRFFCHISCGAAALDSIKSLRIKWNDVNKFSATNDFFTFGFWAASDINVPVSINVVKFCGTDGSIVPIETVATDVITPGGQLYSYNFQFGTNAGLIIDTVNNDDYVAIDIAFPVGISFVMDVTDVILFDGEVEYIEFPLQTNADMVTRGNDGWTDIPAYDGGDLFLPKVQTRIGYSYSEEDVGDIGATFRNIVSPLSASPLPKSNKMLFDGASYIYNDYSTIGIPFSRLGDVLLENSAVPNIPMFGTGDDFATAYANNAYDTIFRLTVNSDGPGVGGATDGGNPTGFAFTIIPNYNGSSTGSASIGYKSYTSGVADNQIICKGDFQPPPNQPLVDGGNPTGFTFVEFNYYTGLYAQQSYAFSIDTVAAASLTQGSGNPASYFEFGDDLTGYYIWFDTIGEIDPGPFVGFISIGVKLNISDTAADVANTLREVMSAYQSTSIETTGVIPPVSSYFTFQSNPGAVKNYHVWYTFNGVGTEPVLGGSIGIRVDIVSGDSDIDVLTKTLIAINKYQYSIPNAPGMFLRNSDPSGIWDFDTLTRFSNVTGVAGPSVGTFEYGQLLSHAHPPPEDLSSPLFLYRISSSGIIIDTGSSVPFAQRSETGSTGGTETRPINISANFYIKY